MINDFKKSSLKYSDILFQNSPLTAKISLEDYDTRQITTEHYEHLKKNIEKELLNASNAFQEHRHIPTRILFHAAFGILINRYSGTDDIFYGMKIKDTTELLPVRSTLQMQDDIITYIKNLYSQIKKTKKNSNMIIKNITEEIELQDIINYVLLFSEETEEAVIKKKKYPLILTVDLKNEFIKFSYHSAKFTKQSIDNLSIHYMVILKKLIENLHQSVTHFSILTPNERYTLLNEWNSYGFAKISENSLTHLVVSKYAKENPDKLAVKFQNIELTYKALNEYANQLANLLIAKGIEAQDVIAVSLERTPCLIVAMLAIFKIDAIYVPINPKYPDDRIKYVLSDSKAALIIANHKDNLPGELLEKVLLLDDNYEEIKQYAKSEITSRKYSAESIAYIMYTSGTTGYPKGVMIQHIGLMNLTRWYQILLSIDEGDRASQFASSGFDSFFCETIPFLSVGASIHIIEDSKKLIPEELLAWLASEKISIADLPTAYAMIVLHQPMPKDLHLRHLKIGGESLSHYPTEVLPFDIWNIYGPTEATVETTFVKIYEALSSVDNNATKHLPPPIGKPMLNAETYIVDEHLELVPIGCTGELLIGGLGVSTGYWNRMQLTHEKFIRNDYNQNSNSKLYRTGDLVRFLPDGNIEFIGRRDHQVKIRGFRIELNEIKATIEQYPDVSEVVVITKEIANGQKTILAYLVENLDKIRIPFQEKCLITFDNKDFSEGITDDLSKEGIALSSDNENHSTGDHIRVHVQLPGFSEAQWLTGTIAWQAKKRLGIKFDNTEKQMTMLDKSIEFYISEHNLMETLKNVVAKRNLRQKLLQKLPEYMIPSVFTVLPKFPLTFNGKIDWKALPEPENFERLMNHDYVPPRNETEKIITEIWQDILKIEKISIGDSFFDLGGNSLLVAELSIKLLEKFHTSIPVKIFFDLPYIDIIAEYIDSKGTKFTERTAIQDAIIHDALLNEDITPTKKLHGNLTKPKKILLTGASGFLGIHLLKDLLALSDATIYCLIRHKNGDDSELRLKQTIEKYELQEYFETQYHRIKIIEGDFTKEDLGLTIAEYAHLSKEIDLICHCGAEVNLMASYSALRQNNVLGTIEIIKFATHLIDKPIHYISTLSAAHKMDKYGNFSEEFPDGTASTLVGGYALSKWVAERLLTEIKNRGLPVVIYRAGYILGQIETGITNINESLLYLIKGCIQLGFAPDWQDKILFLPVDFVSLATITILLHHPTENKVYHVEHQHGITWRDLIEWLNHYGYKIKLCSKDEWTQKLTHIMPENALYALLPQFLAENGLDSTKANTTHADKVLTAENLPYPVIDDALLGLYIKYLNESEFIAPPETVDN